jgi:hypothetical protein
VSSENARSPGAGVFWLIGERVLLLWGQGSDGVDATPSFRHARQLEFQAGTISVTAFQMASNFNVASFGGGWQQVADLEEFASAAGLSAKDHAPLIAAVFGTVAPMFRLLNDGRFKALTARLFATRGLASGHAHMDDVSGIDTAIATVPSRARIAEGDIVVSQGEPIGIGRVRAVAGMLARDNDRQQMAAIAYSRPPVEGPSLVVTARGLVLLDLVVERHDDIEAFRKHYASSSPDRVSLLHSTDDDAAVELDLLARRKAGSASISEQVLGFRFCLSAFASMRHGLFVSGWFHDPDGLVATMTAIDHSLADATVSDGWMLYSAQAGAKDARVQVTGFAAFLPRREEQRAPYAIRFRVGLTTGENHLVDAPRSPQDLLSQRKAILDAIAGHAFDLDVLRNIYQPALAPLQDALNSRQFVRETLGKSPLSFRSTGKSASSGRNSSRSISIPLSAPRARSSM